MIKVNLLNSVTDRARGAAAGQTGLANPQNRMLAMIGGVGGAALLVILLHFSITYAKLRAAEAELEKEKVTQQQMAAVNKEIAELDKKTKNYDARINGIKKLRATQRGPVAVLSAVNERLPQIPNFRLDTIQQKGSELIIKGYSPNEAAVTQFGRSLEFSSGLFTNVNLETTRAAVAGQAVDLDGAVKSPSGPPETINFTVKCSYTPPAAQIDPPNQPGTAAKQIAQK